MTKNATASREERKRRLSEWLSILLEFENPRIEDFDNPKNEWRRLFAEILGTFFLVLVAVGGNISYVLGNTSISPVLEAVAPGLMVMVIILFMGNVSGAHLNPVVSLAFAFRGDFPWRRVPGYLIAQLIGAISACLFFFLVFGKVGQLGATVPGVGVDYGQAFAVEVVLTLGLVSTILGTASGAQNVGAFSAIAVGSYISLAGLWASPLSGASMNPARSIGPQIVTLDFTYFWLYVIGPFVGGLIAVVFAYALRGHGKDTTAIKAAQGTLDLSNK
jgi:aquaporin Z